MAFDLITYIYDQTLEQHKGILAEYSKEQKYAFLKHISALQMSVLIEEFKQNPAQAYAHVNQQNAMPLESKSLYSLQNSSHAIEFFHPISDKLSILNQYVAKTLFSELDQLDKNAHLEQNGLQELILGQQEWLIDIVDDWFWDMIEKPENKVTKVNKKSSVNIQEIVKEFNTIIHQNQEFSPHITTENLPDLEQKTHQIRGIYKILNPIVALLILSYLYIVIK